MHEEGKLLATFQAQKFWHSGASCCYDKILPFDAEDEVYYCSEQEHADPPPTGEVFMLASCDLQVILCEVARSMGGTLGPTVLEHGFYRIFMPSGFPGDVYLQINSQRSPGELLALDGEFPRLAVTLSALGRDHVNQLRSRGILALPLGGLSPETLKAEAREWLSKHKNLPALLAAFGISSRNPNLIQGNQADPGMVAAYGTNYTRTNGYDKRFEEAVAILFDILEPQSFCLLGGKKIGSGVPDGVFIARGEELWIVDAKSHTHNNSYGLADGLDQFGGYMSQAESYVRSQATGLRVAGIILCVGRLDRAKAVNPEGLPRLEEHFAGKRLVVFESATLQALANMISPPVDRFAYGLRRQTSALEDVLNNTALASSSDGAAIPEPVLTRINRSMQLRSMIELVPADKLVAWVSRSMRWEPSVDGCRIDDLLRHFDREARADAPLSLEAEALSWIEGLQDADLQDTFPRAPERLSSLTPLGIIWLANSVATRIFANNIERLFNLHQKVLKIWALGLAE